MNEQSNTVRRSKAWYEKTKREVRADPRTYEGHPHFPVKRLAGMYGVSIKTMYTWMEELNAEIG